VRLLACPPVLVLVFLLFFDHDDQNEDGEVCDRVSCANISRSLEKEGGQRTRPVQPD